MTAGRGEPKVESGLPLPAEVHVNGEPPGVEPGRVERAVRRVLLREDAGGEVSVTFLDDHGIAGLNRAYLGHDRPTDVLAFPLGGDEGGEMGPEGQLPLLGEVYVGAEQAVRQAGELGVPLAEETLRLVIHGLLHLLGYDHPHDADERAESPMFQRQETLLAELLAEGRPSRDVGGSTGQAREGRPRG